MQAALGTTGDLAGEIHALLRETDPVRWSAAMAVRARVRWGRIRERLERLGASDWPAGGGRLDEPVAQIALLVREAAAEPGTEPRHYWMELRARLVPAYEQLAAQLRAQSVRVPTLRPTNWARIAFHVGSALGALVLFEEVLSRRGALWASVAFAATCWTLETARALSGRINARLMRVRFFQWIIHPHEHHRVNSATWYGSAVLLLAFASPSLAAGAALGVLGVGDPLAGLVGRKWGRIDIGGGRTLEGSLALVGGGWVAAFAILGAWHSLASWPTLLLVAAAASVGGALAEALSRRLDDNFTVPIAAAAAAWAAAQALGVPL